MSHMTSYDSCSARSVEISVHVHASKGLFVCVCAWLCGCVGVSLCCSVGESEWVVRIYY